MLMTSSSEGRLIVWEGERTMQEHLNAIEATGRQRGRWRLRFFGP